MRTWLLALAVLPVAGCEGDSPPSPPVVSDSAGVTIVQNRTLDAPTWTFAAEPLLDLGTMDEGGPEQFFRLTAARHLGDRIVAVNSGSRELRIFDTDGAHPASFGREGDGPGEFGFPTRVWRGGGDSSLYGIPGFGG